jgi:hypothetical protein
LHGFGWINGGHTQFCFLLIQSRVAPETEQTIFPKSFGAANRTGLACGQTIDDLIKLVRTTA